jgi:hypothetical protein
MISDAPPEIIAKIRHSAGPNPEKSRLTDNERLHLIWMLSALRSALDGSSTHLAWGAVQQLNAQLIGRGLSTEEITAFFEEHKHPDPVLLADTLAVHPSLENLNPPGCYLD